MGKAGEAIAGIDIVLDYIKRKVVKSTKGPDGDRQQDRDIETRHEHQKERRRQAAQGQEQEALGDDQLAVAQVSHQSQRVWLEAEIGRYEQRYPRKLPDAGEPERECVSYRSLSRGAGSDG